MDLTLLSLILSIPIPPLYVTGDCIASKKLINITYPDGKNEVVHFIIATGVKQNGNKIYVKHRGVIVHVDANDVVDIRLTEKYFTSQLSAMNNVLYDYQARSRCRKYLGNIRGAIDDLSRFLEISPASCNILSQRANLYMTCREFDKAKSDIATCFAIDNESHHAYSARGMYNMIHGNYESAVQDYSHAVKIADDHPEYYLDLSLCKIKINNYKSALLDLYKADKLHPGNSKILYQIAHCLSMESDKIGARTRIDDLLSNDPNYFDAYYLGYTIAKSQNNIVQAKKYVDAAYAKASMDDVELFGLALIYAVSKHDMIRDHNKADQLKKRIDANGNRKYMSDIIYGLLLGEKMEYDKAVSILEKCNNEHQMVLLSEAIKSYKNHKIYRK